MKYSGKRRLRTSPNPAMPSSAESRPLMNPCPADIGSVVSSATCALLAGACAAGVWSTPPRGDPSGSDIVFHGPAATRLSLAHDVFIGPRHQPRETRDDDFEPLEEPDRFERPVAPPGGDAIARVVQVP